MSIYGYFDGPEQTAPAYDPGLDVPCPVCGTTLARPVVTISLMLDGDARSYFYRVHSACWYGLNDTQKTDVDSVLIDAIAKTRDVN